MDWTTVIIPVFFILAFLFLFFVGVALFIQKRRDKTDKTLEIACKRWLCKLAFEDVLTGGNERNFVEESDNKTCEIARVYNRSYRIFTKFFDMGVNWYKEGGDIEEFCCDTIAKNTKEEFGCDEFLAHSALSRYIRELLQAGYDEAEEEEEMLAKTS